MNCLGLGLKRWNKICGLHSHSRTMYQETKMKFCGTPNTSCSRVKNKNNQNFWSQLESILNFYHLYFELLSCSTTKCEMSFIACPVYFWMCFLACILPMWVVIENLDLSSFPHCLHGLPVFLPWCVCWMCINTLLSSPLFWHSLHEYSAALLFPICKCVPVFVIWELILFVRIWFLLLSSVMSLLDCFIWELVFNFLSATFGVTTDSFNPKGLCCFFSLLSSFSMWMNSLMWFAMMWLLIAWVEPPAPSLTCRTTPLTGWYLQSRHWVYCPSSWTWSSPKYLHTFDVGLFWIGGILVQKIEKNWIGIDLSNVSGSSGKNSCFLLIFSLDMKRH